MLAENILRGIILLPSNRSVSIGYVVVTIVSLLGRGFVPGDIIKLDINFWNGKINRLLLRSITS